MKKVRLGLLAFAALAVASCGHLGYYVQAAHGQFSLLAQARPIDDWLSDPHTADKLRHKLGAVQRIRQFAATELGLPDNRSYTAYADLKRPYAVWNVVAAPALSVKAKTWCFPVAGCVNYRGYYSKEDAQGYADSLREQGYDVQVGGVAAYSTLGWFADPVLSTFIQYPEGELARLIFHELAHQVAYVPGDSQFNESFATAVEEVGVERWMAKEGSAEMRQAYQTFRARKKQFIALLLAARSELEMLYASSGSREDKLRGKAAVFEALKRDYESLKVSWGGYKGYDRFFNEPLSNAHLAEIATYHAYVPAFRVLLERNRHDLTAFYASVRSLAGLPSADRAQRMAALSDGAVPTEIAGSAAASP